MASFHSARIGSALAAAIFGLAASPAMAEDHLNLRTVGIDIFPLFGQNQPSTIGDFRGNVGMALFSEDRTFGPWVHFESDMRFMQGTARNPQNNMDQVGQWALI